jgi:hypothetical protein
VQTLSVVDSKTNRLGNLPAGQAGGECAMTNVPEIRFKGFTDAWEQRKLGEVAEHFEYGLNAASTDFDGTNKYIRITDIDDDSREFKIDSLTEVAPQNWTAA